MQKVAKYTILAFVCCFLGVLGWSMVGKYKSLQNLETTGTSLAVRSMTTVEGTSLALSDYVGKVPIVLIYYHSGCDLCRHEISQINKHRKSFGRALMIFVSSEDKKDIEVFKESFDWGAEGASYFVVDEDGLVASTYQVSKVPVSMVFGKDGQLIWRFEGPAKVSSLLNHLSNG